MFPPVEKQYTHMPVSIPKNRDEYTSFVSRARVMATTGGSMDSQPASIISSPIPISSCFTFLKYTIIVYFLLGGLSRGNGLIFGDIYGTIKFSEHMRHIPP